MQNKKILWIEDDADVIGDIVYPLKKEGFIIDIIESLADFKKLRNSINDYVLIILDLIIPQKEEGPFKERPGLEVLEILRNEIKSEIPVVVLTVVQSEKILNQLNKYAVKDILFKPTRSEILKEAVLKLIDV